MRRLDQPTGMTATPPSPRPFRRAPFSRGPASESCRRLRCWKMPLCLVLEMKQGSTLPGIREPGFGHARPERPPCRPCSRPEYPPGMRSVVAREMLEAGRAKLAISSLLPQFKRHFFAARDYNLSRSSLRGIRPQNGLAAGRACNPWLQLAG